NQGSRSVLHHTQDGCRCGGSLSKNQAGGQCDEYTNRYCQSSKRIQIDTQCPYHTPLLSNTKTARRPDSVSPSSTSSIYSVWSLYIACIYRAVEGRLYIQYRGDFLLKFGGARSVLCRSRMNELKTGPLPLREGGQKSSFSANRICRERAEPVQLITPVVASSASPFAAPAKIWRVRSLIARLG